MCQTCAATTINGVYCHEHGCPTMHKENIIRKGCAECGQHLYSEDSDEMIIVDNHAFCSEECRNYFYGFEEFLEQ